MIISYANLAQGGAAYVVMNSKTIALVGESSVETNLVTEPVETALYGVIDETVRDFLPVAKFTPRYYDTAQVATMFPWIAAAEGLLIPTNTPVTAAWNSNNGDTITLASSVVTKMPDLTLGVGGPVLGEMEVSAVIPYGTSTSGANAYYAKTTGNSFSNPAVPGTAVLGNQEFSGAWGSVSGFGTIYAYDRWTISHELKLTPWTAQGRTYGWKLASYRVMAKCVPIGPTLAQIDAALGQSGGVAGGTRLSSINSGNNLVISGSNSITATLANAALKTAGFRFGNAVLRNNELGWVSTLNTSGGGTPTQPLTLA